MRPLAFFVENSLRCTIFLRWFSWSSSLTIACTPRWFQPVSSWILAYFLAWFARTLVFSFLFYRISSLIFFTYSSFNGFHPFRRLVCNIFFVDFREFRWFSHALFKTRHGFSFVRVLSSLFHTNFRRWCHPIRSLRSRNQPDYSNSNDGGTPPPFLRSRNNLINLAFLNGLHIYSPFQLYNLSVDFFFNDIKLCITNDDSEYTHDVTSYFFHRTFNQHAFIFNKKKCIICHLIVHVSGLEYQFGSQAPCRISDSLS